MQNLQMLLSAIEYKSRMLAKLYQEEQDKNTYLLNEQGKLQQIIEQQKKIIAALEESNKMLKISNSIENSKDLQSVKLRINEIVRDVDRCIRLLTTTD